MPGDAFIGGPKSPKGPSEATNAGAKPRENQGRLRGAAESAFTAAKGAAQNARAAAQAAAQSAAAQSVAKAAEAAVENATAAVQGAIDNAKPVLTKPVKTTPKAIRAAIAKSLSVLPQSAADAAIHAGQRIKEGTSGMWGEAMRDVTDQHRDPSSDD